MKKYLTKEDLAEGIKDENGILIIPPIGENTLKSLRQSRKLKYTKLGNNCLYTLEWLQEYLNNNTVETAAS